LKRRRPTREVCVLFAVLTCPQCATTWLEAALTPTDRRREGVSGITQTVAADRRHVADPEMIELMVEHGGWIDAASVGY
jgi:hypothetical protein